MWPGPDTTFHQGCGQVQTPHSTRDVVRYNGGARGPEVQTPDTIKVQTPHSTRDVVRSGHHIPPGMWSGPGTTFHQGCGQVRAPNSTAAMWLNSGWAPHATRDVVRLGTTFYQGHYSYMKLFKEL